MILKIFFGPLLLFVKKKKKKKKTEKKNLSIVRIHRVIPRIFIEYKNT